MFGIPTVQFDYSNDPKVFDPSDFKYDASLSREKNLYNLRKQMTKAYRASGISVKIAEELVARNASLILDEAAKPKPSMDATVIKGDLVSTE
jgi:hypothetical protein